MFSKLPSDSRLLSPACRARVTRRGQVLLVASLPPICSTAISADKISMPDGFL
jgi:hypothetical protein